MFCDECGGYGCACTCHDLDDDTDDSEERDDDDPFDSDAWDAWNAERDALRAERAAKPNHGSRNARRKAQRTRDLQAARRRHRSVYPRGCDECGAGPDGPCTPDCPAIPF